MAWIYLSLAGLFEVVWAVAMKLSHGFTRPLPTSFAVVAMVGSFALLSMAMRTLPLGTAYPVWTGIGAVGTFLLGVLLFGEQLNVARVAAVALIICGLILMNISWTEAAQQ